MSGRTVHLVIDARPRGPRGLLAAEVVLGKSVLNHLLDLAGEHVPPGKAVVVHARADEHDRLRALAVGSSTRAVAFVSGPPRADAAILRTDRLYDPARLSRGLRRGRSPESAVVWRLDRPESLLTADQELTRRLTYQPLGKYWAFPVASSLAERLCPTAITPNALTMSAGTLMLSAAALVAVGPAGWIGRVAVAASLALALVLDTADGRLARLQGTSSAFGQWLDQVLDELADVALHAAIAWRAFNGDGRPIWLLLGITYASGKYLFLIQSLLGEELEGANQAPTPLRSRSASQSETNKGLDRLTRLVRLVGHADIRWHLWIVLALAGRLESRWPLTPSISPRGHSRVRSGRGCVMPEPRVSILIVAKNEAHNLADCLAAASWAFERIVVVDAGSRDATLEVARQKADVVAVRNFDNFASQRNFALALASGDWVLSVDADERVTPALADEVRRVLAVPANPYHGFRVPIRSVILGRAFGFSGTQHDHPLRLFRRDSGHWIGLVHETVELTGPVGSLQSALRHHSLPNLEVFLHKLDHYTTLEARGLAGSERRFRMSDLTLKPIWTFFKLYVFKQGFRDGLEGLMFWLFPVFRWRCAMEAPRDHPRGENTMIAEHEAVVASRFDALHGRFKRALDANDPRLRGCG